MGTTKAVRYIVCTSCNNKAMCNEGMKMLVSCDCEAPDFIHGVKSDFITIIEGRINVKDNQETIIQDRRD